MNKIDHQENLGRFVLTKNGHECLLEYKLLASSNNPNHTKTIDFSHTYVPFALRGQGLAEEVVQAGLNWAKEQGYQIEASCSYVHKFLPQD
jgi:predicted GNAT family acetyltransferase